ncbi:hypothetical protein V2H45_19490 [Tumidithrix elongata RA019]|uniref:Uncharacterized protein n=2 Tax=Tumidithrix TaxID=3088355 RepID=A0AAW9PWT5_9CYAN|nr:hypothetical protein [Tumidithrix elongata RA019]
MNVPKDVIRAIDRMPVSDSAITPMGNFFRFLQRHTCFVMFCNVINQINPGIKLH